MISGSGTVTHQGTGTTTLTAVNSYTGLTSVNAGRLDVDGVIAGSAQVAADATLLGSGSINGTVTVLAGGHLTPGELPGEGAGTLRVGSLVLNPGSQLDYDLGIPDIVGGTVNDHLIVAGALTLDGVLNVTDLGGFSRGVYQLIGYGGALTDNVLDIGSLPAGFPIGGVSISTATPGEVNLVVASGGFNLQYWDGPNGFGNGQVDGGSGFWNPFYSNWTNETGTFNTTWRRRLRGVPGRPGHGNPGRVHLDRGDAVPHRRLYRPGRRLSAVTGAGGDRQRRRRSDGDGLRGARRRTERPFDADQGRRGHAAPRPRQQLFRRHHHQGRQAERRRGCRAGPGRALRAG